MLRRHLLALGGIALTGTTVEKLGELCNTLGVPTSIPLPSRIEAVHVETIRDLTRRLRDAGRAYGADPHITSAAATRATRLLDLPSAEHTRQALIRAVAELHTLSGWAAFDAGQDSLALRHYARALELATELSDPYLQALALTYAGLTTVERGHPGDGLKKLQLAQVKAWDIPSDHPRRGAVMSSALAELGQRDAAYRDLSKGRELWHATHPFGDPNNAAARLELTSGNLAAAEPFAAASVRHWDATSRRAHTQASVTLATIHVQAGEQDGLGMAHNAITAVRKLSSVRARQRLQPLAEALDTRPGTDARDLARTARQVTTQA